MGCNSHWHPVPLQDNGGWTYDQLRTRVLKPVPLVKRHRDGHYRGKTVTSPTADGETVWAGTWIELCQRGSRVDRIGVALHGISHSSHSLLHR